MMCCFVPLTSHRMKSGWKLLASKKPTPRPLLRLRSRTRSADQPSVIGGNATQGILAITLTRSQFRFLNQLHPTNLLRWQRIQDRHQTGVNPRGLLEKSQGQQVRAMLLDDV